MPSFETPVRILAGATLAAIGTIWALGWPGAVIVLGVALIASAA